MIYPVPKDSNKLGENSDDDDKLSDRSGNSSISKKSKDLHKGNFRSISLASDQKTIKPSNTKKGILTWPRGYMERLMYVIFYPFYLLYWLVMPNIMHNPEIIKVRLLLHQVLIGILFSFLFFIGYAYLLTKIQEDLIFNFAIKPHLLSLFNAIFYSLS